MVGESKMAQVWGDRDKDHGRLEIRRYNSSSNRGGLAQKPDWMSLASSGIDRGGT